MEHNKSSVAKILKVILGFNKKASKIREILSNKTRNNSV